MDTTSYPTYSSPYDTTYSSTQAADPAVGGAIIVFMLIYFVVIGIVTIATIIGLWKVFTKAGKPGWAAIVPIYNMIVLCEIVGRPAWWVVLMFVPIAQIVAAVMIYLDLAKSFGKDAMYGVLILFFPFVMLPILGFGKAQYVGPAGVGGVVPTPSGTSSTGQPLPPQPVAPAVPLPSTPESGATPEQPVPPTPPSS